MWLHARIPFKSVIGKHKYSDQYSGKIIVFDLFEAMVYIACISAYLIIILLQSVQLIATSPYMTQGKQKFQNVKFKKNRYN